jgi:hypothetical protein
MVSADKVDALLQKNTAVLAAFAQLPTAGSGMNSRIS